MAKHEYDILQFSPVTIKDLQYISIDEPHV